MDRKVVELDGRPRRDGSPPVTDFWFAQVDVRLSQIEFIVARLEWQIWLIVCGCAGLLIFEIVKVLSGVRA
ncbi:hypothetical protein AN191_06795 [Loktanella sp. 5RATIMAR09]|uniref:hypothetical protein n=1 Tax=Loktanella sp. 5RATIMAR09 TaxID=1225655 RepID=UPI0006EBA709|nr:hypothetical protein [Loktanella sp. 5RATIMAR09]KQI72711.1 hypothetical protein AN191_06795 [Loktanella sp. 5RATIMAR09]